MDDYNKNKLPSLRTNEEITELIRELLETEKENRERMESIESTSKD